MRLPGLLVVLALTALPALAQEAVEQVPVAAEPAPPIVRRPLQESLTSLVSDPLFTEAAVSVQVVDTADGRVVWQFGEDVPRVPASTMKILTTAVALRELGPSWRFPTWVLTDGPLDAAGVLDGNLYIKGQGDPTMVVERLWRLGMDLELRGLKEVKGNVIFDDGYFADTVEIPGWSNPEDLVDGPTYFAPLGALSVNYNVATLVVRPGAAAGSPAVVEAELPTPAVVVVNQVTTGSTRSRKWFKVERELDESGKIATYTVSGNIPSDEDPVQLYRAVADPLGNYIGAFRIVMQQHGIKVKGSMKAGTTPPAAKVFHTTRSDTLAEVLAVVDKQSNNFMAEQILRAVGAEKYGLPGTTEKGLRAVESYLVGLGATPDDFHLVNGSGLSREVLLRPSLINAVLVDMDRDPSFDAEFRAALAVGGRDGTLWSRFRDDALAGRVRGKTGTLNGVHCLAGFVDSSDGHTYAFSFLVNELEGATARARRVHDQLVVALAGGTGDVADGQDAGEP